MAHRKGGLGRGISALIPGQGLERPARGGDEASASRPVDVFFEGTTSSGTSEHHEPDGEALRAVPGVRLAELDPQRITPNAQQPRQVFREDDLQELIHSVREFGVLQPIVVREHHTEHGDYELIMGERRLRAAKAAGLATIPAIIKSTRDENMLRDALLENLHRSNLNPLEEASAYQQLLTDFGITQEQLADRIGRSRPQVSNMLRLLRLPERVQQQVAAGVLSAGHARALVSVGDAEQASRIANRIVGEGLSVREVEALVKNADARKPPRPKAGRVQAQLAELSDRLGDRLDTRVRISLSKKKGQIVIDFATVSDLNRIAKELGVEGLNR